MKNFTLGIVVLSVVLGLSFEAQAYKKESPYKKFKDQCLTENSNLKGKNLQGCIKKKHGKKAKVNKKKKAKFED